MSRKLKAIKRARSPTQARAVTLASVGLLGTEVPIGYHRFADAPEAQVCISRISGLIASLPIHLLRNTPAGDVRESGPMARLIDVEPWSMGSRYDWISWIVTTLLLEGNAFLLPITAGGQLLELWPMPGAVIQDQAAPTYSVAWEGHLFHADEVAHVRLWPDPRRPWRGLGPQTTAAEILQGLSGTRATQRSVMETEYKPPLIVSVATDSGLSSPEERSAVISKYVTPEKPGQPWILPGELLKVDSVPPVSLSDLAIRDGLELDKRTVAAIFGVPAWFVGVGGFNRDEYNYSFLPGIIRTVCTAIEQALTRTLLDDPALHYRFSTRQLYAWSITDLASVGVRLRGGGLMSGNEVRDWVGLGPKEGLDELIALENYIPVELLGSQKKLYDKKEEVGGDGYPDGDAAGPPAGG